MAGITHAPVISSISSTLLRILPIADATNGGGANVQGAPSSQAHGDNVSVSTKSSCSSCVSSCPSNNNKNNEQGLFGNYRLVKTLGVGEFGKVKLGIHSETKQKVAIKVIKKKDAVSKIAKVEREIQILKSLRHPHIVKLIEVVETDTHIGIVLEYASGGELFEYVLSHRSLDEDTAKNLFAQLISSVNHMHGKGIAHRDLKLENLLFLDSQQTHLVVSDFGFSNNDKKDFLSTCCGSPTYAAPELIYPSNGYRGEAADIWSCGVILYCMICGYLPFDDDPDNIEGANILQLYRYIRSRSLSFPGFVSDDAQDLIRHMLQPDPVYRCTINFVINHPWLNSHLSTLFAADQQEGLEHKQRQVVETEGERSLAIESLSNGLKQTQLHHNGQLSTDYQHDQHLKDSDHSQPKPYFIDEGMDYQKQQDLPTPTHSQITRHGNEQQALHQNGNKIDHILLPELQMDGAHAYPATGTLPPTPMSLLASSKLSPGTNTNNTSSSVSPMLNDKELPLLPPLPAVSSNANDTLGQSDVNGQPKSVRRQKKFRPTLNIDAFSPIPKTTTTNTTPASTQQQQINKEDKESNLVGIRPSLLGKDDSTRYYSAMLQDSQYNTANEHTSFMNEIFGDNVGINNVQYQEATSLPLLHKPTHSGTAVDSGTSTSNLYDASNNNENAKRPNIRKQRTRLTSILSLSHPKPKPRRTQSAHIMKKQEEKDDKKETSPVTNGAPLTRRVTMTQAVKTWLHNKKPFTRRHHSSSLSSLSGLPPSSSADNNSNDQQQVDHRKQQQQQIRHYLASSSSFDTMDQSLMRTLTHAQGENLTSMAPSNLILTLVRVLTALGMEVHHRSAFQLTCLRKSCHHHHFYHWHGSSKHNKDVNVTTAPIYGPPELDHGHHVEFTVEICRSLLPELYAVDMDLVAGDHSAFQFLKSKALSLMNLKT